MAAQRLFLIDGHSLCYRSFFAIRELATSSGAATNAVYGFVNTLRKILREQKPDYIGVCFDSKEKTHREAKYTEYKIQRPMMPERLITQIPIIKEVLKAYHVEMFEEPGYEADDLLGTLVKKLGSKDLEVTIVSDDKDLFQLAGPGVRFYSARKDEIEDAASLEKRLGFPPRMIVDFIGLAGDNTDNIPGVKGIGEVTARALLKDFGSLENIYKNVKKVEPPKVREKLETQKEQAFLSKELAILDTEAPFKFQLAQMKVQEPDSKKLYEMFSSLEFRRLSDEYATAAPQEEAPAREVSLKKITTKADAQQLITSLRKNKQFAFLTNATEEHTLFDEAGLLISEDGSKVFEIASGMFGEFKSIFEDPQIQKITYDLKMALKELNNKGFDLADKIFDVKLASYLAGLSYATTTPTDLAWRYLKQPVVESNKRLHEVACLVPLYPVLLKELIDRDLIKLHDELEIPLSVVLYKMENQGVRIDLDLLSQLSQECAKKISHLEKTLYGLAGEEFNLNSPKQLSKILFEKLKLPSIRKTKTGFSTDEGVLTVLSEEHEVPALILEYRQLAKLKSTYIDALPKMIDPKSGRIHAEFDQIGAETGRFSSRNPNLQNIPIRTELGREIRKAFIPSQKGNVLLSADYSQIELRILAHLSQDDTLLKAFKDGDDIHTLTAATIFNVKESEVDYHMRDTAKRVNFGIIYGMSSFGLSKDLKISTTEAQAFIDTYFLRYPKVKNFVTDVIKKCEATGYATTLLNRRRYIPEITSQNNAVRQFAQRQAINTPVQGSAADLMKLAMINVQQAIEKKNLASKMIMTVHDELVFDIVKQEEKDMIDLVCKEMESPMNLSVPIKVSLKIGPNWLQTKEV